MSKIKVLFLTERYPNHNNPITGIPIKEYIRAVSYFNDSIVINGIPIVSDLREELKSSNTIEDGVKVIRLPYKENSCLGLSYIFYLIRVLVEFKKLLKKGFVPDIIHAHIYFSGIPAVLLGRFYHIPVVITEHNSLFLRKKLKYFDILKARFVFRNADIILPLSLALLESIKSYGIRNNFKVIGVPVDTTMFYPPKINEKLKIKRMLYVGALIPLKGISYLIAAINGISRKRDDFVLNIIGAGSFYKAFKKQIEFLGIQKKIIFHGIKTREEVSQFMRDSDFFVLPSRCETFSCAILEAISSGLPVISSRTGAIPELVKEGRGILIPPESTMALEEAINYMLDNYQSYSPQESHLYAVNRYGYEVIGNAVNQVYAKILKSKVKS